jgi:predicted metal-dependent HD superfamily phosphohydrolase
MQERWRALVERFSQRTDLAGETCKAIADQYNAARRYYHTLEHIANMLNLVQEFSDSLKNPVAVELAVWLHDVIYDSRAKDNEERSADFARELLTRLEAPIPLITETERLILLTKTHRTTPEDTDGLVLLDADLSILGAPAAEYERYAANIRQEYSHVPEELYRAGRLKVLHSFVERAHLFLTPALQARFEGQAKANLQLEILHLAKIS